jgi:ribosome-binding ATPase YchF (GTP1/OBG family)
LGEGKMAYKFAEKDSEQGKSIFKESQFLTDKKVIYCCNVAEDGLMEDNDYIKSVKAYAEERDADVVKICGKMEEDLNGMSDEEREEFLKEYGVKESGLDQIVHTGYHTLGLISYLTQGPKETRAWTIHIGDSAPQAAGVIHSDFERGFIRAQVIAYNDFIEKGGELACREAGLLRTEGKEYIVQDGDVIEFLFNV